MVTITLSLLAVLATSATAQQLARLVKPASFEKRNVRATGGYALIPNFNEHCPNDMLACSGGGYCCPMTLTCSSGATYDDACCPEGIDCAPPLLNAPYCVDDSWSLWDKSQGGIVKEDYFCCSPGHVGTLDATCVDEATVSSPTIEPLQISPGGGVVESSTVVVATASGSSSNSITQVTISSTTTASGSTIVSTTTSMATSTAVKGSTSTEVVSATSGSSSSAAASTTAAKGAANSNKGLGFGAAWAIQGVVAVGIAAVL